MEVKVVSAMASAFFSSQETQVSFHRSVSHTILAATYCGTYRCWVKPARWETLRHVLNSSLHQAEVGSIALQRTNNLQVKLQETFMAKPSWATPSNDSLTSRFSLSNLDLLMLPVTMQLLFFYRGDPNRMDVVPAKVLKEALDKVLVHYYPLAGRLSLGGGRPFVECNGAGVVFADANANIPLVDLGDLTRPDPFILAPLVPAAPADDAPLLSVQVTRFKCGGFVLGVAFRHCMLDGCALMGFMNSWAAMARAAPLPCLPVLDKPLLEARSPLRVNNTHDEFLGLEDESNIVGEDFASGELVLRSFCFTLENLEKLRRKALEDGELLRCTAFQALSALIWKVRTTALCMRAEQEVKLLIGFDGRLARGAGFPRAYLGNSATFAGARARAGELERGPLSFAAKKVRDAVKRMTGEYIRSQVDYLEHGASLPAPTALTFGISSWVGLPLYEYSDFGWGEPMNVLPANAMIPGGAVFLAHGEARKDVNVLLCQSPQLMDRIEDLLRPHLHSVHSS